MNISEVKLLNEIESAIEEGDLDKTRTLLLADRSRLAWTTNNGTWLHLAAELGQLSIVQFLLQEGMDVNLRASLVDCAPITLAAAKGQAEMVRYLAEHGAELDASKSTRNPLFAAIYGRSIECVKVLLETGIDARVRYTGQRMKNMDAIGHAEERGEKEIAALIRDYLDEHPEEKELK
jgi:uncharacterized protein